MNERIGGPQTGRDPKINPDVPGRSRLEQTSTVNVLKLILAGMSPMLLSGDTPLEGFQSKAVIEDTQKPKEEPAVRLSQIEIDRIQEHLSSLVAQLRSPEIRNRTLMLKPNASLKQACRAVSDWMMSTSADLDLIWRNLYSRKDVWSEEVKKDLNDMIKDMASVPGSVKTLGELDEKTRDRLIRKQPLKCGIGVWAASFIIETKDVQERGIGMTEHIMKFVANEMNSSDLTVHRRAFDSAQATVRILESLLKGETPAR
ncbi:MAG: hypothetical protein WAZ27_03480 [Minisyncoccia bacterium]